MGPSANVCQRRHVRAPQGITDFPVLTPSGFRMEPVMRPVMGMPVFAGPTRTSPAPCVWVVDDDSSVLDAISRVLRSVGYKVRTFASGELLLAGLDHEGPGCILLDLWMPGMTGLEVQEALARSRNPASVIFITAHADVASSICAMKAGAVDFLVKPFDASKLFAAVESAMARTSALRSAWAEKETVTQLYSQLTPREREVLGQMLEGKRNKQIAGELGAAERTVKTHRARVMQKMRVHSIAELASRIERAGLGSSAAHGML
jgi:FixJ family two-component response regulator